MLHGIHLKHHPWPSSSNERKTFEWTEIAQQLEKNLQWLYFSTSI